MNKKLTLALYLFCGILFLQSCNSTKNLTTNYNYELLCNGIGVEGVYLVKCFSYGSTFEKARKNVKKDAVHGTLFKGVSANSIKKCKEQPRICNVNYEENKDWFDRFFNEGDYLQYVTLSNDGNVSSKDRIKIKGGYKVGFTVSVKSDALRKRMEKEGFAKKMDVFDN